MKMFPSKKQWNDWTIPSKASYLSAWIAGISLLLFTGFQLKSCGETEKPSGDIHQNATGNGNIQIGTTGDDSPIYYFRKEELSHKIQATEVCYNKQEGDLFITRIALYSKHPIPNLYLAAHAKTIVEFDINPQRTGKFSTGHSGKREGFWFTNIPNFGGKYLLVVKTKESEKVKIEYDIE